MLELNVHKIVIPKTKNWFDRFNKVEIASRISGFYQTQDGLKESAAKQIVMKFDSMPADRTFVLDSWCFARFDEIPLYVDWAIIGTSPNRKVKAGKILQQMSNFLGVLGKLSKNPGLSRLAEEAESSLNATIENLMSDGSILFATSILFERDRDYADSDTTPKAVVFKTKLLEIQYSLEHSVPRGKN